MSWGESGYPPWPLVSTALLISIQPGFQANVCKKTSCFFPSPWHLCAWNNDRDFSSDALYVVECGTVFTFTGKCLMVESIQLICSCQTFGALRGALMVLKMYISFRLHNCHRLTANLNGLRMRLYRLTQKSWAVNKFAIRPSGFFES